MGENSTRNIVEQLMHWRQSLEGVDYRIPAKTFFDIMASRILAEQLADRNPVTDLPNLRAIPKYIEVMQRSFRRKGLIPNVTIYDMDLKKFKEYNELYGDFAGDQILGYVGETLESLTRPDDLLCNPRGDQFLVIAPGVDESMAGAIGQRYTAAVDELVLEEADKFGQVRQFSPSLKIKSITVRGDVDFDPIFRKLSKKFYEKPRE